MIINSIKVERSELNIEITIKDESFAVNGVEVGREKKNKRKRIEKLINFT
jgi:hypothetical protein